MRERRFLLLVFALLAAVGGGDAIAQSLTPSPGNRLAYLDEPANPYYVGTGFARLTTPQWVGDPDVKAVALLSIDDMRDPEPYERFLRPILDRLKKIDGRAPVSIFTCGLDPEDKRLQGMLSEGISIEVHTTKHPCPLLARNDFDAAKLTVDNCIELLARVPNMKPVAFRMPCCDSINSVSPRFFEEIFNKTTTSGQFLTVDSSVFTWFNKKEKLLPAELLNGENGKNRFSKYIPRLRGWINLTENYPFPYVIGNRCWEFPSVVPSDWEAQDHHGKNNPLTVTDLKAALDASVLTEGMFTFVFHPHGWIQNQQVVELVDHAVSNHGKKIQFLNMREAAERINKNALGGQPIRKGDGGDNGVRVLDLNNDGYMDVVIGNDEMQRTRLWDAARKAWSETDFPVKITKSSHFGVLGKDGSASLIHADKLWHFRKGNWVVSSASVPGWKSRRLRDLDGDGICELIADDHAYRWKGEKWEKLSFGSPADVSIGNPGCRLADLDGDGDLDLIYSGPKHFMVRLFESLEKGWAIPGKSARRGEYDASKEIPLITRGDGSNNGAWFGDRHLIFQNEETGDGPAQVIKVPFKELIEPFANRESVLDSRPLEPSAALRSLVTSPGMKVELVAAEPEVMDPIDMAWGADGRLWVVEMADYPLGIDGKPGGRVRWLEDRDGDGRYETSRVFLDKLPYPTGVLPWRKGVLILAAPDLIYAEDRDGDGLADRRDVLYTGFGEGNQQHRVNGLRWGLDNWIYLANGDSNGQIKSVKTGRTVNLRGRDLRIRPDTGDLDAQSGRTQYGRNRDDWGNWFGCNNSNPLWHFALTDHYLRRNPDYAPPSPTINVIRSGGRMKVFPASRLFERFNDYDNLGKITSACGAMIYRDSFFGDAFDGNAFVCEPVHNLVHRELIEADGYTFVGSRPEGEIESEFFASRDPWCRPVSIRTGPDGALWIADMYRLVIEHPEWIPKSWQARLDLRTGHDRGRIYRVRPEGKPLRAIPDLADMDVAGMVALLESSNGTVRDLVHRELLWKAEPESVTPLQSLAQDGKSATARLHALCVLDGLKKLPRQLLVRALGDDHPGVRRHAIRLCETLDSPPAELAALADDKDAQVQMQLAYTLGTWDDEMAGRTLAKLAGRHGTDDHYAAAVMSSASPHLDFLAEELVGNEKAPPALADAVMKAVASSGKAGDFAGKTLARLSRGDIGLRQITTAAELLESVDGKLVFSEGQLDPLLDAATRLARNTSSGIPGRVAAVRLLSFGNLDSLMILLTPEHPVEVQQAVVDAVVAKGKEKQVSSLLIDWKNHGPSIRARIAGALAGRANGVGLLLSLLEDSPDSVILFQGAARDLLLRHPEESVRTRANKLFKTDLSRELVIANYREALSSTAVPNMEKGREVFAKNCAICHSFEGVGKEVGPDLMALTDKSEDALRIAILDPNRAVEDKYQTYIVRQRSGQALAGIISAETATSLTLMLADGSTRSVLRKNLSGVETTGRSLMPEGLEGAITPDEMHQLIEYLSQSRGKRREFPGNKPQVIKSGANGGFDLPAKSAWIYGPKIELEERYGNLGMWGDLEDSAVWRLDVRNAGRYRVELDFACHNDASGNPFRIAASSGTGVTGKVPGTGSWDKYETKPFGVIELKTGPQRIEMRAGDKMKGFLIDLRKLVLTPVK